MARQTGERSLSLQSREYKGLRKVIVLENRCGMCNPFQFSWDEPDEETALHEKCSREIAWFDKLWICPCPCNKDWVPQDVGDPNFTPVEKKSRKTKPVEQTKEQVDEPEVDKSTDDEEESGE